MTFVENCDIMYKYTKQNLTENMQIEGEQVLEDNSLLLTIDM